MGLDLSHSIKGIMMAIICLFSEVYNKVLELTQNQRSARGEKMWRARMILSSESVSGSSSSLKR